MVWAAHILTIFPEMFPGPLGQSILGKSLERNLWSLNTINIRDFAKDKHQSVDDTCFGGGAGMVFRPDVLDGAIGFVADITPGPLIYLTPRGKPLTQSRVEQLSREPSIKVICGRYEGVDERIFKAWDIEEISLGDFVLAGGEVAAMALVEACVRLIPGVLGKEESHRDDSFSCGLLEHPHYTRPQLWNGLQVPDVLLSGHHEKIDSWRFEESLRMTKEKRPDLYEEFRKRSLKKGK